MTQRTIDQLTYKIIGCAIEVHKYLGPGLLESVYEKCLKQELYLNGISYLSQKTVPIEYKSISLEAELRYDILVEDTIVVEVKAVEGVLPIHEAILMTYMKMLKKPKGLMLNFHCNNIFSNGQKTFVNEYYSKLPK
jgi:GxxExxY protein